MPHSDVHKQKKKKNYTILGLVFIWCLLIFCLTVVKMARADGAHSHGPTWRGSSSGKLHHPKSWAIPQGAYHENRKDHHEGVESTQDNWKHEYHSVKEPIRMGNEERMDADRGKHSNFVTITGEDWVLDYDGKTEERSDTEKSQSLDREEHLLNLEDKPKEWWEGWVKRYNDPDYDRSE